MIDKDKLKEVIDTALAGTPMFLTELSVSPDNNIRVEVDSDMPMDIDACTALTRSIEQAFDRDAEDYELEVGSAGITSPLKVRRQYAKYLNKDVEVLTADGRKLHGVLLEVAPGEPTDTDVDFTLGVPTKVRTPESKKPVVRLEPQSLNSAACKYVRYDLKF